MSRTATPEDRPETLADVTSRDQPTGNPAEQPRPVGLRIDGYFGVGLLRPGVGKLVQRTGVPQFCGSLVCRIYGYSESPGKFDVKRVSRRFAGEFFGITYEGKQINAASGYIPSSLEMAAKAALDQQVAPINFAGEIWCEPDEAGRATPLGYRFVVYDRRPRGAADPLMQLAASAGIISPIALPAPEAGEVDPETGEVIERQSAA